MDEKVKNFRGPIIILLAVATILGTGLYIYSTFTLVEEKKVEEIPQKREGPFYAELLKKNEKFAQGESLFKSGNYTEAIARYEESLENVEGYKEEGQIKYKIGLAYLNGDKPMEAIAVLKEVAKNKNYTERIRAYAVQSLGNMLYSFNTQEVRNEVFKGNPYKKFLEKAKGNQAIAERKLFEYASSLYPLGVSEMRIAKWHSSKVVRLVATGNDDEETKQKIEDAKSIIREKIKNTDAYLVEIVNDEQERVYLAEVWRRKATVLGDLFYAGDTTFPNPEGAYKTALQFAIFSVGGEASAKYSYALFLAKMYGEERASDIQGLLSDFYNTNKYSKTGMVRMIRNEKDGLSGNKESILLLAKIDTRFSEYLKTLGWEI
jgi:hypothetical protein